MSRPSPLQPSSAPALLALLALALAGVACGGSDSGPEPAPVAAGPPIRVELWPESTGGGYRPPRSVWSSTDEGAVDDWRASAGRVERAGRGADPALRLVPAGDDAPVVLEIPLERAVRGRLLLRLEARAAGDDATVEAAVLAAGERLAVGRATLPTGAGFRFVGTQLGGRPVAETRSSGLRLAFRTDGAPVEVRRVELIETSPDRELGAEAFGGTALIHIRGEGRRATALRAGTPLVGELESTAGRRRLRFAFGVPPAIDSGAAGRRLAVAAEGARSGRVVEAEFELSDAGNPWRPGELDLGPLEDDQVLLRFEYRADGPDELLALAQPLCTAPRAEPRTVVLITSDTHRADHVGYSGAIPELRTEAIDALAARGVAFLDTAASANNTTPSHAALMTGLTPRDTQLLYNGTRLDASAPTLAEAFRDSGYVTLASVSALPVYPRVSNLGQGFDRYSIPATGSARDGRETLDRLLGSLAEFEDQSVFAWLHLFDAHAPYRPAPELAELYYDARRDPHDPRAEGARPELAPAWAASVTDPLYIEALYRGEVTYVDRLVAELLALPRVAEGLVAFTADHGEVLSRGVDPRFEHSGISWNTLAVPLVFAGADLPAGAVRTEPARQVDTGRTLLDLAGLADRPFPGRNLFADGSEPPAARFAIEANGLGASIVRDGQFLRVALRPRPGDEPQDEHRTELFDLERDRYCERDVAAERPDLARALRAELIAWLDGAGTIDYRERGGGASAAVRKQLAELGYADDGPADTAVTAIPADCDCAWCERFR